jgi:hypothetical protein
MVDQWQTESEFDDIELFEYDANPSAWDTCAGGWPKDAFAKALDEMKKIGYPGENDKDETKPIRTGLREKPYGLHNCWSSLSTGWNISIAKLQKITTCHGISIISHEEWFKDLYKVYLENRKIILGSTDPSMHSEVRDSQLSYHFYISDDHQGGGITTIGSRAGFIGQIEGALGLTLATTLIELNIISIMTIDSRKLSPWKNTFAQEHAKFLRYADTRQRLQDVFYDRYKS